MQKGVTCIGFVCLVLAASCGDDGPAPLPPPDDASGDAKGGADGGEVSDDVMFDAAEDNDKGGATTGDDDAGVCACATDEDCAQEALDPCSVAVCIECACEIQSITDGTECDDGDDCTEGEACSEGACLGGGAIDCDDGNVCTSEFCDEGECVPVPEDGVACDDGKICTEADQCFMGQCLPGENTCEEDCTNGKDDTENGLADCADPKCAAALECINECIVSSTVLTCDDVLTVDVPTTQSLTSDWPCSQAGAWDGGELGWVVAPSENAQVTVALTGAPAGVTLMHVEGEDCAPAGCVLSSSEVTFGGGPSAKDLVVLEAGDGAPAQVELTVTCAACVKVCDGKQCGPDGCGGACGQCGVGDKCIKSKCASIPDNDTCADAIFVPAGTLPAIVSGTTAAATDDYSLPPDNACTGANGQSMGQGPGDVVYRFTPQVTQDYVIALDADYNAALYLLTDCSNAATCEVAANTAGSAQEKIITELKKGVTYYIVVDGFGGTVNGPFKLTVNSWPCAAQCMGKQCGPDGCGGSCGGCAGSQICSSGGLCTEPADNDNCADAKLIDEVPWTGTGKTTGAVDDYFVLAEVCPGGPADAPGGQDAPDVVYRFVAPQDGKFKATVTPNGSYDTLLSVMSACPFALQDCVAGSASPGPQAEEAEFVLSQGEQRWLIVDGASAGEKGSFSLTVEAVACTPECTNKKCGPDKCGGECGSCGLDELCTKDGQCAGVPEHDTCDTAIAIPSDGPWPWEFTGSTLGAQNDYQLTPQVQCTDGPVAATEGAGNDVVFVYVAPSDGKMLFTFLDFATTYNTYLYTVKNCSDLSEFCLASPNSPVDGGESIVMNLTTGETVFVVVDGWSKASNGTYTFQAKPF